MEYLLIAICAALTVGALVTAFQNLIKARTIEDIPTSKIRSAHQGYVELTGLVTQGDYPPVIAPLTHTACLWYGYKIEEYRRTGDDHGSWQTREEGASQQPILLSDNTGECHIYPQSADITAHTEHQWYGDTRRPLTTQGRSGKYRYTEQRIHADHWLYVLGLFQTLHAPSAEAQKHDQLAALLNEWKRDQEQLLARFDRNGDGAIDLQEWEHARQEAARQAHHYVLENYDDSPVHTMSRPPGNRQPYIISTQEPRQLTTRYRRRMLFSLALFFILGAITVAQLTKTL